MGFNLIIRQHGIKIKMNEQNSVRLNDLEDDAKQN